MVLLLIINFYLESRKKSCLCYQKVTFFKHGIFRDQNFWRNLRPIRYWRVRSNLTLTMSGSSQFGIGYPIPSLPSNRIRKLAKNSWYYQEFYQEFYQIWAQHQIILDANIAINYLAWHRVLNAILTIKLFRHWLALVTEYSMLISHAINLFCGLRSLLISDHLPTCSFVNYFFCLVVFLSI